MQTVRIKNAPLFVMVLSACLGLMIMGAPSHLEAQQTLNALAQESPSGNVFIVALNLSFKHQPPENAPQVAAPFDSHLAVGAAPLACVEPQSFSPHSPARANLQTLVVTRFARASLEPPLA